MANYTYTFHDALTMATVGNAELFDVTFNDPVEGVGALKGKVIVKTSNLDTVRACVDQEKTIIVVRADDQPVWAGLPSSWSWDSTSSTLDLAYTHVKSYIYNLFLRPNGVASGNITDVTYSWSQIEQTIIATQLMAYATGGPGAELTFQAATALVTGVLRDLNVQGFDFKYAGDLIDTMSNRSKGFDWTIEPRNVDGLPVYLFARYWYPERKTDATNLYFEFDPAGGGNILNFGNPAANIADRRTRVWATGAGSPPDQAASVDTDPMVLANQRLLTEKSSSYSSVTNPLTLHDHAQAERLVLAEPFDQITLAVKPDNPATWAYGSGDRARIVIKDLWLDIDVPSARIVDRSISPFFRTHGESMSITVDLSDLKLPDADAVS